ncbi:hypothetical protein E4U56_006923 [Claviceps arundinis]|uniref:Uncharacterized protein n=1 Tax=Claviceps arundinis TaxID=1623583 RepID=A0A9P7SPT7_9HYPO|nr:hypothetical protein E4U56_006923 [Claviceps arundinis]
MRKILQIPHDRSMSPPPRTTPLRALPQAAQFQSTPRFGSTSVPRPSQRREPSIEDVEVEVEDRQASLGGSVTGWDEDVDGDDDKDTDTPGSVGVRRAGLRRGLDLEIDSITSASSSPNAHAQVHTRVHGSSPGVWDMRDEDMDSEDEEPDHDHGEVNPLPFVAGDKRAKRRRIVGGFVRGESSISSWSSSWEKEREREREREKEREDGKERAQDGGDITPTGGSSIAESESASYVDGSLDDRGEDEDDQDSRGGGDEDEDDDDDGMDGVGGRKSRHSHQQPIFQPPPPFKPPDIPDIPPGNNILPMGFSPRRPRGRPYPPGGMAAQLQAWLSEVRGWDGESRPARRMVVGEVRPGPLMYLARERCEDQQDQQDGQGQVGKGYILAGEGKLTGMGGGERVVVRVGGVVVLEEPVWEVELLGEMWTVVCNWSVES